MQYVKKNDVCVFSIAVLVSMAWMASNEGNLTFLFPWHQTKAHVDTLFIIGCRVTMVLITERLWLIWNYVGYYGRRAAAPQR